MNVFGRLVVRSVLLGPHGGGIYIDVIPGCAVEVVVKAAVVARGNCVQLPGRCARELSSSRKLTVN